MKKFLLLAVAALVLFLISASLSWVMRSMKPAGGTATQDDLLPPIPERAGRNAKAVEPASSSAASDRTAARPPYTAGAEEAVQLAASLRDRLAAVREREAQLTSHQKHMELVYEDLRGERGAIDELRKQVNAELNAVEEKMVLVERKHTESEQKRQEITGRVSEMQKNLVELEGVEQGNIKKMAEMYDNMEPESAARILQQLADTAKMETAVKVLAQMKERQAAKVLAAMPADSGLAAQLLEKLKGFKRPAATARK